MDFTLFKTAVQRHFNVMSKGQLFFVDLDKNVLWETYLAAFPEGSNPMFKQRTEHDCNCCKQFIRTIGSVVAIVDNKVVSLWDITVDDPAYQTVANKLSEFVKSCVIKNKFLHTEASVGTDKNFQLLDGLSKSWGHFQVTLPKNLVVRGADIGTTLGEFRTTKEVMQRGLTEITDEAVETVLELIGQNSLYRGEEHKFAVTEFQKLKNLFKRSVDKDLFCWSVASTVPASVSRIRNTSIGTLLSDISEGYDLEDCIKSFEAKVAPTNYKRPTAIVTKAMIEKAKQTIEELGFTNSLRRRYAVLEDISINNILFADRSAKPRMNDVFDELIQATPKTVKNLDKVEEVTIDKFLTDILPGSTSVELMLENSHAGNFVSLIAPDDITSKTMFKWSNGFSWSYTGDMADSIKERVKRAGGSVEGDLCCRLSWDYTDDLDFHMLEPKCGHIYYSNKRRLSDNGGILDLDANGGDGIKSDPAENIYYRDKKTMKEGIYTLKVHNFNRRSSGTGFDVEVEFDGTIHSFHYDKIVKNSAYVEVAQIKYSKAKGFEIISSLPSSKSVKSFWNLPTQSFHKVNVVMLSPNHWDGNGVGNKHYFFMLEGCANDGTARGFFNEFLNSDMDKHRKVLEIVGSKMKTAEASDQLSGVGFSSTQRNSVVCRVTGSFSRLIKINF